MKHAFLHALLPSFAVLLLLPLCAAAKPRLAFTPEPAAMTTPAAKPAAPAPAQTTSKPAPPLPKAESDALLAEAMRRGMNAGGLLLIVDVPSQTAYLYSARTFLRSFAVSTSKFGVGSQSGSQKTPLGWHRVEERFFQLGHALFPFAETVGKHADAEGQLRGVRGDGHFAAARYGDGGAMTVAAGRGPDGGRRVFRMIFLRFGRGFALPRFLVDIFRTGGNGCARRRQRERKYEKQQQNFLFHNDPPLIGISSVCA